MATIDKLIDKFRAIPNDFSYGELVKLLKHFDYEEQNKGKTSGSRIMFYRDSDKDKIMGHKPHASESVSRGFLKAIKSHLEDKGEI